MHMRSPLAVRRRSDRSFPLVRYSRVSNAVVAGNVLELALY